MARTLLAGKFSYSSLIRQYPKLSRERELELALRWRDHGDTAARDELVRSQLRHVVANAHRCRRHSGVTLDELIAEGSFGLLQAIAKFDPGHGTRLVTYAVYWIRAYITQYLIRSRSVVTTGVQSKMLSKIHRERQKLSVSVSQDQNSDEQVADRLAISPEKLRSLTERLQVRDLSWEASAEDGGLTDALESPTQNPEESVLSSEMERQIALKISSAVTLLSARERYVVERRHLAHREDQLSLAEIGRHFCVSRERARQIEISALRKLKTALRRNGISPERAAFRSAA